MKKLIYLLLVMLIANVYSLNAQHSYTSLQYSIGFGTGDLGDYISKTSFRGFLFEYRKALHNDIRPRAQVRISCLLFQA